MAHVGRFAGVKILQINEIICWYNRIKMFVCRDYGINDARDFQDFYSR